MTVPYCELQDVYRLGLSARSFVMRPRPLDAAQGDKLDAATGTFWMMGHGLASDDLVWLMFIAAGGTTPATLPSGSSAIVPYYPLPLDFRRFRLATSPGGTAVTFSDVGMVSASGASAWGILVDPEQRLRSVVLAEAADIDQCLTAHSTPLLRDPVTGLYPQKIVDINARGAARRAIAASMFDNAATKIPTERLDATKKDDDAQKEAWRQGQPIYPNPLDQTDGIADNGGRAANRLSAGRCSMPVNWVTGRL